MSLRRLRATGDWLAFSDADDWFAPERLRTLVGLGMAAGTSMVADNLVLTRGMKEPTLRTLMPAPGGRVEAIGLETFLRRDRVLAIGNLGLLKPIIRRRFLATVGVRYDEDPAIGIGEDALFYISCLLTGETMLLTDEPTYFYRQHQGSLSRCATVESLRVLRDKNMALLARARSDRASALARVIDQRLVDFNDMIAYRELGDHVRRGHVLAAARCLGVNRRRLFFLLLQSAQGIANRLVELQPVGRTAQIVRKSFTAAFGTPSTSAW